EDAARKHFECPLDCVRDNLREFGFIELKKGWIPERFGEISSERFSFVHIDVDLYQPIRDSLEFFYPRMIPGGIIVLDDYGYLGFPGAKKATDEFIKNRPDFFLDLPSGSAFIIKK
ncbi:MAG TPA: TylF/MycF/NovP-related O-methyltransferase, partial [Methanoregula sp.]|nr:TylF/MycF/NovP-related O-methyltransferase [Methanoregula sp.]